MPENKSVARSTYSSLYVDRATFLHFKLSDQVTEDEILDKKNYGTSDHKCTQCSASKDENGFCNVTRHEKQCFQKASPTTKVFYMRYGNICVYFLSLKLKKK